MGREEVSPGLCLPDRVVVGREGLLSHAEPPGTRRDLCGDSLDRWHLLAPASGRVEVGVMPVRAPVSKTHREGRGEDKEPPRP